MHILRRVEQGGSCQRLRRWMRGQAAAECEWDKVHTDWSLTRAYSELLQSIRWETSLNASHTAMAKVQDSVNLEPIKVWDQAVLDQGSITLASPGTNPVRIAGLRKVPS